MAGLGIAPVPSVAFSTGSGSRITRIELEGIAPVRYSRAIRAGAPLPSPVAELLDYLKRKDASRYSTLIKRLGLRR